MSHQESSLPDAWVERIWSVMRATYGASFDRQWQCPEGVDPSDHVKSLKWFWAQSLSGYQQSPQAIHFALDNLPAHPPNLVEFKSICMRRPEPELAKLPEPKADPKIAEAVLKSIEKPNGRHPKEWAENLQSREQSGERLSQFSRGAWREALNTP
jgi:hypothetical protein